jgi:glycosyltransferase involved in cell wall biosynthesis
MENKNVKISFGIIVLNGEPFIKYCLRSLYKFAHEIIVVEGATEMAKSISTKDGHSLDNTLEILKKFKQEEDPDNKIKLISKDGYWTEKDEQSQAYAKVATGNYLWQVDMDEFYKEEDMRRIIKMLEYDPDITAVSFEQITFWGDLGYKVDSIYLQGGAKFYHRLFKWGPGYKYVTHRPPTVENEKGSNLRDINWVKGKELSRKNIYLYHYSLLFPRQVEQKVKYYSSFSSSWGKYARGVINWSKNNFLSRVNNPFQLHNMHMHAGWIEKYKGGHPKEVNKMIEAIKTGKIKVKLRDNSDIEILESKSVYRTIRALLQFLSLFAGCRLFPKQKISKLFINIKMKV